MFIHLENDQTFSSPLVAETFPYYRPEIVQRYFR